MSFFLLLLILVIVGVFVHGCLTAFVRNFFLIFVFLLTSTYGGISNCPFMASLSSHSSLETMSTSSNPPGKLSRRMICKPIGTVTANAGVHDERLPQREAVLAAVKAPLCQRFSVICMTRRWICLWRRPRWRGGYLDAALLHCCLCINYLRASHQPGTRRRGC